MDWLARIKASPLTPYAGVALLAVLAYFFPYTSPSNKTLSLATSVVVYSIAASGLGLLWGQSGQLTLAHAAVFGLGAYAAALTGKFFSLGFVAALPVSIGTGLLAGAIIALPSLRTTGHYFVILTFAIGEVLAVVQMRLDWLTGGANGTTTPVGTQSAFGYALGQSKDFYSLVVLFAAIVLMLVCYIMRSRWGIILRSIRENADLATSLGVNIKLHRLLVFSASGAIAGLAGQLFAYQVKYIAPTLFTSQTSILLLLVVLLGGKSYLLGPVVGALVYFFLPYAFDLTPIQSQIAFGAVLVIMILLAPSGLLGSIWRALHRTRAPKAGAKV